MAADATDEFLAHGLHDVAVPGVIAALQRIELLRKGAPPRDPDELLGDAALALTLVLDHLRSMQHTLSLREVVDVRVPSLPEVDAPVET